jgi:hypothetical protein
MANSSLYPMRSRLRAATCALLAVAGSAAADGGDWHFDAATLKYSEQGRVSVVEPLFRLKHDFTNGRSLTGKVVFDVITGASPTGATPSDQVQTVTSASGNSQQQTRGIVPVKNFRDHRESLDLEYEQPLARTLKAIIGGQAALETDYASRGGSLTLSWDTSDRLTTFTAATSANFDRASPKGGMRTGLDLISAPTTPVSASKQILDGLVGVTRILSPRWLMQLNYGRTRETGYLTEPYKIVSIVDSTGNTIDYRNEKRPDNRQRQTIQLSSVYNVFDEDVIHVSYRFYWDDWGIRSHTVDFRYRFDLSGGHYLEPHLRFYGQSAVNFYTYGLRAGAPLPEFATSDYRYGKMNTNTFGVKYGFPVGSGELNVRLEYMVQSGNSHPSQAVGVQRQYDLFPPINITILQVGYTVNF